MRKQRLDNSILVSGPKTQTQVQGIPLTPDKRKPATHIVQAGHLEYPVYVEIGGNYAYDIVTGRTLATKNDKGWDAVVKSHPTLPKMVLLGEGGKPWTRGHGVKVRLDPGQFR